MLGYKVEDIDRMINAVHDVKLFYLHTPSDLIDKGPLLKDLQDVCDILDGLLVEGHVQ